MKTLDKPKKRFYAPSIVSLLAFVVIVSGMFALGFAAGVRNAPQPTRQASEAFDRSDYREAQPAFVKMPDELP